MIPSTRVFGFLAHRCPQCGKIILLEQFATAIGQIKGVPVDKILQAAARDAQGLCGFVHGVDGRWRTGSHDAMQALRLSDGVVEDVSAKEAFSAEPELDPVLVLDFLEVMPRVHQPTPFSSQPHATLLLNRCRFRKAHVVIDALPRV